MQLAFTSYLLNHLPQDSWMAVALKPHQVSKKYLSRAMYSKKEV
jgi:hypothetical protein